MHKRPSTPRHEPEAIDAEARKRWRGDSEKVATTSVKSATVHGVLLESRYDKAHEYDVMAAMVEHLSPSLRSRVRAIFCDSKMTASYAVTLRGDCKVGDANEIGRQLGHACGEQQGGHNGIVLSGAVGAEDVWVDPDWRDFGADD
jgi:hypothetical protein